MEGKILYKELSYQIIGCAYNVYNQIGSGYAEKYYERALRLEFNKQKISYREQVPINLNYDNQKIGKYIVDFIIDEKILVELKRTNRVFPSHKSQILNYLQSLSLKLGLLIYFTDTSVQNVRIINYHLK